MSVQSKETERADDKIVAAILAVGMVNKAPGNQTTSGYVRAYGDMRQALADARDVEDAAALDKRLDTMTKLGG